MWHFYRICIWHSKTWAGGNLSVYFVCPESRSKSWKLGNNWKVFACSEMLRNYWRYLAMPKTTPAGKRATLKPISSVSWAAFYFSCASLHSTLIPHPPFVECFEICRNIPKCFGIFSNLLKYFETFWTTLKYVVQVSSNILKYVETFRTVLEHSQILCSVLKHVERLWNNLWKSLHSFLIVSLFQNIVPSFGLSACMTRYPSKTRRRTEKNKKTPNALFLDNSVTFFSSWHFCRDHGHVSNPSRIRGPSE